ncbi:UPF0175 family protein [Candidatus Woesearchaeota archaeon]|nr:UPF0175 family protein [Candidatus Woesearchaeota archaeon]
MAENMKVIALRLDKESAEYLNKVSSFLKADKSTVIRNILHVGIEEDRKQRALELYKKNKLSLGAAAKFAQMYIGDFLDLMAERGVENNLTLEMVKKATSLKDLK